MNIIESAASAELLDHTDAALRQMLRLEDDETHQDSLLDAFCSAARARAEAYTRKRFITRQVVVHLDGFECGGISLPTGPIASVVAVKYIDGAGVQQTMAAEDYILSVASWPNVLHPAYGSIWPTPRMAPDVVEITLTVGYGASSADAPADIVQAVRWYVAYMYEHRDQVDDGTRLPMPVIDMLGPHRLWV